MAVEWVWFAGKNLEVKRHSYVIATVNRHQLEVRVHLPRAFEPLTRPGLQSGVPEWRVPKWWAEDRKLVYALDSLVSEPRALPPKTLNNAEPPIAEMTAQLLARAIRPPQA